ncbi:MAG: hypothetical protein NC394_06245 [Bacteroides sp.]|nr:hypothetical protein [Bacteroides sp.]
MKKENKLWQNGVVLSFDLSTKQLRKYFSRTAPHGAYGIIKRFLAKNKFEHTKDSDYVNENISKLGMIDLLTDFSTENKWFPLCVNKINISPNVESLNISEQIKDLADVDWQAQKDAENDSPR